MQTAEAVRRILEGALEGRAPGREECVELLRWPEASLEAALTGAVADGLSRERFGNAAVLLGQIGMETAPCPGGCRFCVFGEGHTAVPEAALPVEEILERARDFTAGGELYALFLMTMHTFDFPRLLSVAQAVRAAVPGQTQLVVNVGDFDAAQARDLRAAGVNGAYHVLRLREGEDTRLEPEQRRATVRAIREAGLDWYYCCEPIGPEHTPQELVEQIFFGVENGCFQHAAMRRVAVPGTPLADRGQITERRLAQFVAVVTLASLGNPATGNLAVHEPNLLGLAAGANAIYAETGCNPRDTAEDTSGRRGLDAAGCREMLQEAGFTALLRGDEEKVALGIAD